MAPDSGVGTAGSPSWPWYIEPGGKQQSHCDVFWTEKAKSAKLTAQTFSSLLHLKDDARFVLFC